jgi:hypothetical protein
MVEICMVADPPSLLLVCTKLRHSVRLYGWYPPVQEQRNKYDPTGLFVPPLFTSVMARSLGVFYPGCAVAGMFRTGWLPHCWGVHCMW